MAAVFKLDQTCTLLSINIDKRGRAQNDKHRMIELEFRAEQVRPEVMTELLGVDSADELAGLWSPDNDHNVTMLNMREIKIEPVSYQEQYEATVGGSNFPMVTKLHGFKEIKPDAGGVFSIIFKMQLFDSPGGFTDRAADQLHEGVTVRLEPTGLDLNPPADDETEAGE